MGLFTTKEKVKLAPEAYPGQRAQLGSLAGAAQPGALERLSLAGTAYPGELTAGLSEPEQMGLQTLKDYLASAPSTESAMYKAGESELMKTLGGEEYDPLGGAYYQAYRNQVMRELQEAKDRLAASTSARDKYFGGGRIKETGNLEEGATNQLAMTLATLAENERTRRAGAVPQALQYTQYGEQVPVARVAAAEQYGALPREVEQQGLDREYQEWIRQLTDLGIPLDTALALATMQPNVVKTGGGVTDLGFLVSALSGATGRI